MLVQPKIDGVGWMPFIVNEHDERSVQIIQFIFVRTQLHVIERLIVSIKIRGLLGFDDEQIWSRCATFMNDNVWKNVLSFAGQTEKPLGNAAVPVVFAVNMPVCKSRLQVHCKALRQRSFVYANLEQVGVISDHALKGVDDDLPNLTFWNLRQNNL